MKKSSEFTAEDLDPFLHKHVVVTYRNQEEGSDSQLMRGVLDEVELASDSPNSPSQLVIRNESEDRLKVSIHDLEDIREGQ